MRNLLATLACLVISVWCCAAEQSQPVSTIPPAADLGWWREARLGLFIHWGPVSLKGTEIGWSRSREVSAAVYDNLYKQFNPTRFDAKAWVAIAKEAGMKYLVITSKHHDGFCLWDSKLTDYDVMATPFGRDVVRELAEECSRQGIRFCLYHSICDWRHPDYPLGEAPGGGKKQNPDMARYTPYLKGQLRELLTSYGPIGIVWFDGEWEEPWTHEHGLDLYRYCRSLQSNVIINNRVDKGREGMEGKTRAGQFAGDYETPEQQVGRFNTAQPWETCMTICQQWAWKPNDQLKSLKECLDILITCAGGDGNLLLNIGPMPSGEIEPRQVERLKEMGQWLGRYGQSIYGTRGGPFRPSRYCVTTHRDNTVYVHILKWPGTKAQVVLPGINRKIISSTVLTGGTARIEQSDQQIAIHIPPANRQEIDTIVALTLDGPAAQAAVRPAPVSLAQGKTTRASNIFQNDLANYGPGKATDGESSTRWATDWGIHQAWLEVDLGSPAAIGRVMISEAIGQRVQEFELQVQLGEAWHTFYRGQTIGEELELAFPPITARHVRLNILKATDGPTIWEFQLFAPERSTQHD